MYEFLYITVCVYIYINLHNPYIYIYINEFLQILIYLCYTGCKYELAIKLAERERELHLNILQISFLQNLTPDYAAFFLKFTSIGGRLENGCSIYLLAK